MDLFSMNSRMALIALALAATPLTSHAHPKGLHDTQQQAEQRAKELGCTGTHQNSGKWMPCSNEATLHQQLRHH
ncbi:MULTISPECIES: DUF3721 domain-containing protein [unclassified Cyanobium]|jgi:hypothetical protein|uniref:DUF3721 domain-containing protein n=1 Tax=unclassified Cyanobium TaxID=2627006 RepID=UPI0020CE8E2E|nr:MULTISPECIES: DUF3721 domain-containing protein [unclassified Cyanobium]